MLPIQSAARKEAISYAGGSVPCIELHGRVPVTGTAAAAN